MASPSEVARSLLIDNALSHWWDGLMVEMLRAEVQSTHSLTVN